MRLDGVKVLLVAESGRGGGAEQVASHWRSILREHGAQVRTAVLRCDPINPGGVGVGAGEAFTLLPLGLLARVVALRRLIKGWRPDAVIGVLTYPNLLAQFASVGLGARLVLSEHTVPTELLSAQRLKQKIQLVVAKATYRRADALVAVSHAVATDLKLNFKVLSERLWVLPNQVTAAAASPNSAIEGASYKAKESDPIRLLVPGRITWAKRPATALKVADELKSRGHEVTVEFIGTVTDSFPVARLASSQIEVIVSNWDDRWATNASPGSIVLLTSAVEGFGNVLVDAARAGLASVAGSSALGVADAIVDGTTGILASPDSPSAYADAIEYAQTMTFGDLAGWIAKFGGGRTAEQLCRLVAPREKPRESSAQ